MNYWWEVDGNDPSLTSAASSSEMVQEFLLGSRVVKALSHMGYHHLLDEARPALTPGRKAIAIAADSADDARVVSEFIDSIGFDPLFIGPLHSGKKLEPGSPAFGANVDIKTLAAYVSQ